MQLVLIRHEERVEKMLITAEQARKRLESPRNLCNILGTQGKPALSRACEQQLSRPVWERLRMPDPRVEALMKELGIDRALRRRSRRVAMRQGIPAKLWWEVVGGGHFTCH
jgi:hypothetical protein